MDIYANAAGSLVPDDNASCWCALCLHFTKVCLKKGEDIQCRILKCRSTVTVTPHKEHYDGLLG